MTLHMQAPGSRILTFSPVPRDPGFGVYVHWPFCAAKCPYCDFNSHVRHKPVDQDRYASAFERELKEAARRSPGETVTSIFLGGGTPSLMEPETVGRILDAVAANWTVADGAEITLEANPSSVEATRFRGYRAAGVNRVSLGVQALNDPDLRRLGRLHDVEQALGAIRLARETFPRLSFDLIYARPDQTVDAWEAELSQAIDLAADHLSLYQLTIEQGTPFHALYKAGKLIVPDGETSAALYEATQRLRPSGACRPTRFPTMRCRARNRATTSPIGAMGSMPGSAPARMAGSWAREAATRSPTSRCPRPG